MSEWQIELTWTCAGCKSRVLGRHTQCTSCGKPKENEEYDMPADPSAAPAVTDPALLRMATAGENWRCAFCGSDRRALDGSCGRCGAGRAAGAAHAAPAAQAPAVAVAPARKRATWPLAVVVLLVGIAAVAVGVGVVAARGTGARLQSEIRKKDDSKRLVRVTHAKWEHVVAVDAWRLLPRESFSDAVPPDALDVRPMGEREHHQERVQDGTEPETYTVEVPDGYRTETYTVEVPDGYRSESYTERVSCGQDCKTTPPTCRQVCTNNKNGFASCTNQCSGGGTSCTTRYCNETRTRQIPKTRTETRTRQIPKTRTETRTRQVPHYKMVPRMMMWESWKQWGWQETRVERASGEGADTRWPELTALPDKDGKPQERLRKSGVYAVTFTDAAGNAFEYAPRDEAELRALASRTDELRIRVLPTVKLLDPE